MNPGGFPLKNPGRLSAISPGSPLPALRIRSEQRFPVCPVPYTRPLFDFRQVYEHHRPILRHRGVMDTTMKGRTAVRHALFALTGLTNGSGDAALSPASVRRMGYVLRQWGNTPTSAAGRIHRRTSYTPAPDTAGTVDRRDRHSHWRTPEPPIQVVESGMKQRHKIP